MLLNPPDSVPRTEREPLAMTIPSSTLHNVQRLLHGQSPGKQGNSNKQQRITSLTASSLFQLGAPFPICITSCQPCSVIVTAHLFGLHGPISKSGPKTMTRWKIGHNFHKTLTSLTSSLNTGFPSLLSNSIFPTPTGTEIYNISITLNVKLMYFQLGNRQGQKSIAIYPDLPPVTLPF